VLAATSTREFGGSTLQTRIFLERRFRAHLVSRDRLLFDSAYAPPSKKVSPFVHLYASLRGSFHIKDASPIEGTQAYVLAQHEFDRVGPGTRTFRSHGAPSVIVELRLAESDLRRPIGIDHGQLALPDHVWAAYHALDANPSDQMVQQLMVALAEAQVLSPEVAASVVASEPERFVRVWTVLKPLYEDLATSTSLKQIAAIARLSLRQLGRDLGEMTRTFGLPGAGFRDAMRVLRLRAACLWLSAPGATPSDVARTVGYGSLDAMGRAFRDANLPAPSLVQEAVRYPG